MARTLILLSLSSILAECAPETRETGTCGQGDDQCPDDPDVTAMLAVRTHLKKIHRGPRCDPAAKDPPQMCPDGNQCPASGICGSPGPAPGPPGPVPTPPGPAPPGVRCDPTAKDPPQMCPDGNQCPASGICGAPGPAPGPPGPAPPGESPALKWTSVQSGIPKAIAGYEKIRQVASEGVIDNFMAANPEIKRVLWSSPFDGPTTVNLVMDYARNLVINQDLESYMNERGFTFDHTGHSGKRRYYVKGDQMLSAKPTRDFAEENGPNNGFMRVFFHDVAAKLRQFDPRYGWDESFEDALFYDNSLYIINRPYYTDQAPWNDGNTPRNWILPQMHYLGVFANDIASGPDQNFALNDAMPTVATPVDLDAVWRGDPRTYSFLKVLSTQKAAEMMENNYIAIH